MPMTVLSFFGFFRPYSVLRPLLALLWLAMAGGCALLPDEIDQTKDWSANKLYSEAKSALTDGSYEQAIKLYEKLDSRYPFGRYAQQAEIEIAYAYYKSDEPTSAIAALDRFIKLYPRHPNLDYIYYLRGLVSFNQGMNIVERYLPTDRSQRDPGAARQSFQDFGEVVRRFPDSKYAADSRQRMVYLRNNLAQYEVHVATHYLGQSAYLAAANRGKYVVEHYQQTPAVPEALAVMVRAYQAMGMNDLVESTQQVLQTSYPNHSALALSKVTKAQ
ncbi:Outer membrane protein assembly factor BamD [Gammaproteobacteria bacterium]